MAVTSLQGSCSDLAPRGDGGVKQLARVRFGPKHFGDLGPWTQGRATGLPRMEQDHRIEHTVGVSCTWLGQAGMCPRSELEVLFYFFVAVRSPFLSRRPICQH